MPSPESTSDDLAFAKALFNTLGATEVLPENALWAVTAVSGSGPGYVALVAEAMLEEAVDLGLDSEVAKRLIAQTIAGTGQLLNEENASPAMLRKAVTTPGGTTQAGLESMQSHGLEQAIRSGIRAAHDRGQSLANDNQ